MTGRIYPFGYSTRGSQERLEALMQDEQTIIVDIRYKPYCQWNAYWRKDALLKLYGDWMFGGRYRHLGALGNTAYASMQQIKLANPVYGIAEVKKLLEQGYTIILLCACQHYDTCHRKTVTDLVRETMPEVEVCNA